MNSQQTRAALEKISAFLKAGKTPSANEARSLAAVIDAVVLAMAMCDDPRFEQPPLKMDTKEALL